MKQMNIYKNRLKEIGRRSTALSIGIIMFLGNMGTYADTTAGTIKNDTGTMYKVASNEPVPQEASKKNELATEPTQADMTNKFNISTDQPARMGASGKEIDKKQGPLGSDVSVMNKIYQLAVSYKTTGEKVGAGYKTLVYDSPVNASKSSIYGKMLSDISDATGDNWGAGIKKMTGADIDGNSKEELITVGYEQSGLKGKLQLYVSDYNQTAQTSKTSSNQVQPKSSPLFVLDANIMPLGLKGNEADLLKIASGDFNSDGKDEVAISFGNILYICDISMTKLTLLSKYQSPLGGAIDDLKAFDSDKDGFKELLVTHTDSQKVTALNIYNGIQASEPTQTIPLVDQGEYLQQPCVDQGDIFGDNEKVLVIAGTLVSKENGNEKKKEEDKKRDVVISYLRYDQATETYSEEFERVFRLPSKDTTFENIKNHLTLKCATLETPVPGKPVASVVVSGFIFKYNADKADFEKRIIDEAENSTGKLRNIAKTSQSNITNFNAKGDEVVIYDIIAGNFDGNTNGKEQIMVLHKTQWYKSEYLYVSVCQLNDKNQLTTYANDYWRKESKLTLTAPAIAAPYILEKGLKFELMRDKSMFIFSNPTIVSVLGATPHYEELETKYASLSNVATTYGQGTTTGSSKSNGIETKANFSFGAIFEFDLIGLHNSQEVKTTVESSFTANWEKNKSITKSYTINNGYSDDAVALMVVPYDIYYYKVSSMDPKTNKMVENIIRMEVPYAPQLTVMSVTDYNERAKTVKNMPQITDAVLKHTVGDPRSYQKSPSVYGDPKKMLIYGSGSNDSWMGSGIGNVYSTQAIEISEGQSTSYDYGLSVEISFNFEFEVIQWGGAASVGYKRNVTVFSTKTTSRTGQVAGVPTGYPGYEFSWLLVAYNYTLETIDTSDPKAIKTIKQTFPVINYLVKTNGEFPPRQPQKVKAAGMDKGIKISWVNPVGPTGYSILRATSENGTYSEIGNVDAKTMSFIDEKVEPEQTYYYKLMAYNSKKAEPTVPVLASTLMLTGMTVMKQPILTYLEGGKLDLKNMAIQMIYSDKTIKEVPFNDFKNQDIAVNIQDGTSLNPEHSGTPVIISKGKQTARTSPLMVEVKDMYDFSASTLFKVGGKSNPTTLIGGQKLEATTIIKSKVSTTQNVIGILVLYSEKGNMVQYAQSTKAIKAMGTETMSFSMVLPSNVNGYTVKLMIWDGENIETTKLNPKAQTVSFPVQ